MSDSCATDTEGLLPTLPGDEGADERPMKAKTVTLPPPYWIECGCLHKVRCVTAEMIPDGMQEAFIPTGYRPWGLDWVTLSHTLFQLHNETWNIWTHLLGFVLLLAFTFNACSLQPNPIHPRSKFFLILFLLSLLNSLMGSFLYHWFHCKNDKVFAIFRNMDYSAIPVLIACSLMAMTQYTFVDVTVRTVYTTIVGFLGFLGVLCCYIRALQTREFRVLRSLIFAGIAVCGMLPLIHMGFIHGFGDEAFLSVVGAMALPVLLYGIGMGCYVSRVPERLCPNFFLFHRWHLGYSHTFFHLFVIAGGVTTYMAIVDFWRYPPFVSPLA